MKTDELARLLAGSMTLLSVGLAYFISSWWLLLTCFVRVNLFQSALTGFCAPIFVLTKLGWVDNQDIIHWGGVKKTV